MSWQSIITLEIGESYNIGSTCLDLKKRLQRHKAQYRAYIHRDRKGPYYTSFRILDTGNYKIQLVEPWSCEKRFQLVGKEREWIERSQCVNKILPGAPNEEEEEEESREE